MHFGPFGRVAHFVAVESFFADLSGALHHSTTMCPHFAPQGWKLVKAMKRRYLQLEYCNGVHTRALRDNVLSVLNLSTFNGHQGIFGIEVVGAIFLAHFLRLNSSVTDLCFRRNDVQKDGAKALAQSLLGPLGSCHRRSKGPIFTFFQFSPRTCHTDRCHG